MFMKLGYGLALALIAMLLFPAPAALANDSFLGGDALVSLLLFGGLFQEEDDDDERIVEDKFERDRFFGDRFDEDRFVGFKGFDD
jgi:hypothetical protein